MRRKREVNNNKIITYSADEVGTEVSWLDNEHADVMGSNLLCKRLGCSLERCLGRSVQRARSQRVPSGDTGDVYNGARLLSSHSGKDGLECVQRAEEVGVDLEGGFRFTVFRVSLISCLMK